MKHHNSEPEITAVGPRLSKKPMVSADVKNSKPKLVLPTGKRQRAIIVVVAVLLVAGGYGLYVWRKNAAQKAKDKASVSQLVVDLNSPAGMITGLKQKANELSSEQKDYAYEEDTGTSVKQGKVLYKSDGAPFMVESKLQPNAGFSYKITTKGEGDSKQKKASQKLRDTVKSLGSYTEDRLGLKKVESVTYKANLNDTRTIYSNGVIYCSIPEIPEGQIRSLDVDCASKEKIDEATAEIKSFIAKDLEAGGKQYEQYMRLEHTRAEGQFYISKIGVDTGEKLYYVQSAGNPTWTALGAFSTKQPEACARFEANPLARAAFIGNESCTDGTTVRKVR